MDLTAIFTLDNLAAQLLASGIPSRDVAEPEVCEQLRQIDTPHLRDEVIYDDIDRAVSANIDFDPMRLATASAAPTEQDPARSEPEHPGFSFKRMPRSAWPPTVRLLLSSMAGTNMSV